MITSLALALPTIPMANTHDRALFVVGAKGGAVNPLMVHSGAAVIDDALVRIVPAPYRVLLDESVPATMHLVWSSGDNWMDVLTHALAPVGLVAEPDWAKNSVKISWRKRIQAPDLPPAPDFSPASGKVAAAPAAPANPSPSSVRPGSTNSGFAVNVQSAVPAVPAVPAVVRSGGSFVVIKPDPVISTPAPRAVERTTVAPQPPVGGRFVAKADGTLPTPDVMWQLMKAAVSGDRIVLSGLSGLGNDEQRARYSRMYADKLRANLLSVGFPSNSVVVGDRFPDRSNKAGVRIVIDKGDV